MAKKILVVDDERHIVRLVQVNLERAGYEVIIAYDGVVALEKAEREKVDMVITDDWMPRMNGFELLEKLRSGDQFPDIPVIMLGASNQDAHIFQAYSSGVTSHFTKPFDPKQILAAVQRIFSLYGDEGFLGPAS